jgi:2-haloacid dehalogenase
MPSALVFDAYGTLFNVHSVQARCEEFWPGKGALLSQAWRGKQLEYSWLRSLMGRYVPFSTVTREALEYACASLGLVAGPAEKEALMNEYLNLAPFPEVPAALGRLRGRKLAILTNGSPDMIDPLVKNRNLEKTFDAVLSVDEIKVYKPAFAVYEMAVRRLRVPKEDIGFVSSNCWDALGAKSFGFRVYWINRAKAPIDRLGAQPDQIIGGLDEILP